MCVSVYIYIKYVYVRMIFASIEPLTVDSSNQSDTCPFCHAETTSPHWSNSWVSQLQPLLMAILGGLFLVNGQTEGVGPGNTAKQHTKLST